MPRKEEQHRDREEQGKELRRQRGVAQVGLRQLARALNCPHSFLSQVETGKTTAPAWLRRTYADIAAGTPLHRLSHLPVAAETDPQESLLRQRLAVQEELVITVGADGSALRFLHRLRLRALSTNVPAVVISSIAAESFDDWRYHELEGGTFATGRRISGLIDVGIKFPAPLDRREEHFVSLLLEPPPGERRCLRWPSGHYGLRRLSMRLWQPLEGDQPLLVSRIDGATPHEDPHHLGHWSQLFGNAKGLTTTEFAKLRTGFGYGLVWEPARQW